MHSPLIVLGIGSVTVLRASVGFLIFLLGISLKRSGEPAWFFGLVIVALGLGSFVGNALAPVARRHLHEERILGFALVVPLFFSVLAVIAANRVGTLLAALGVGAGAAVGRQAFDAVVQRETHELDRGRAFARFDTRFQLAWVLGALLPVLLRPPLRVGFALLALGLGVGLVLYLTTLRSLVPEPLVPEPLVPEPQAGDDEPRADQPRADQPRADQPRADQPRADQPRADEHGTPAPPDAVLATARRLLDTGDDRSAVVLAASAALDRPRRPLVRGDPRCAQLAALRRQALGEGEPLCAASALAALDLAADLLRGAAPR
jgi:MFS family permease